jgi:hypothetical protein
MKFLHSAKREIRKDKIGNSEVRQDVHAEMLQANLVNLWARYSQISCKDDKLFVGINNYNNSYGIQNTSYGRHVQDSRKPCTHKINLKFNKLN